MKPIHLLSLSSLLACSSAHAGLDHFIDAVPDRAYSVQGAPAGACPLFFDGFDEADVGQPIEYITSGGYTIKLDHHTITITDFLGTNTVQHWGDPHENLNGKHIKDWGGSPHWEGLRRTLLLGDGSKVTMEAAGPHGVTTWTSIYDGDAHVQFDNCRSQVAWQGNDPAETTQLERTQYDGEASSFSSDAQTGVARYDNAYNEDESFERVGTPVPLGTTGGFANPNQVNDLFDDPRLGHT